jgi:hypothetical protein
VQYALLESVPGLQMTTAHVAAATTCTLVVLLVVLLAKGAASGQEAVARTLIMVAPQLSSGYAVDLAAVPLLLCGYLAGLGYELTFPSARPPIPPWRPGCSPTTCGQDWPATGRAAALPSTAVTR